MMSGMCGAADVMSIDSGPESEFRFQDLDESGAAGRSKSKRGTTQNIGGDVTEDGLISEAAQAYGMTGKRISIKRRSQSSQQQIKKVIGAGGIPRPPLVAAKNDQKMFGASFWVRTPTPALLFQLAGPLKRETSLTGGSWTRCFPKVSEPLSS